MTNPSDYGGVIAALNRHVGVSVDDLDAQWRSEAEFVYELGSPCTEAETFDLSESILWRGHHDCDSGQDTIDARDIGLGWEAKSRTRCIRVPESRVLRLSLNAPAGTAVFAPASHECDPSPCEKETATPDAPIEFEAAPCTWRLWFTAPVETITDWEIELVAL